MKATSRNATIKLLIIDYVGRVIMMGLMAIMTPITDGNGYLGRVDINIEIAEFLIIQKYQAMP